MISGPARTGEALLPTPAKQGKTSRAAAFPDVVPSPREAPADTDRTGPQASRKSSAPTDAARKRSLPEPDSGFDPATLASHLAIPAEPPAPDTPRAPLPEQAFANHPAAESAPLASATGPAHQPPAASGPALEGGGANLLGQIPTDPLSATPTTQADAATPLLDQRDGKAPKPPRPTEAPPAASAAAQGALAGHALVQQPANALPAEQAAEHPAEQALPIRHKPARASATSVAAPAGPATTGTVAPVRGPAGSESKQSGSGGQDRPGAAGVAVMVTSQQSLPFRLEPAPGFGAVPADQFAQTQAATPATSAAPEAGPALPQQGADILIGLDSDQRLDVTIATATRQAADRVEAARADLHRDLSAVGAEVEAIRVEVRGERAPDAQAQGGSLSAAGSQSERQGQAMRNQKDQQGDEHGGQAANAASQATAQVHRGSIRIGLNSGAGRIDRYA